MSLDVEKKPINLSFTQILEFFATEPNPLTNLYIFIPQVHSPVYSNVQ